MGKVGYFVAGNALEIYLYFPFEGSYVYNILGYEGYKSLNQTCNPNKRVESFRCVLSTKRLLREMCDG